MTNTEQILASDIIIFFLDILKIIPKTSTIPIKATPFSLLNREKRKKMQLNIRATFLSSLTYNRYAKKARSIKRVESISVLPEIQAADSVWIGWRAKSIEAIKERKSIL